MAGQRTIYIGKLVVKGRFLTTGNGSKIPGTYLKLNAAPSRECFRRSGEKVRN